MIHDEDSGFVLSGKVGFVPGGKSDSDFILPRTHLSAKVAIVIAYEDPLLASFDSVNSGPWHRNSLPRVRPRIPVHLGGSDALPDAPKVLNLRARLVRRAHLFAVLEDIRSLVKLKVGPDEIGLPDLRRSPLILAEAPWDRNANLVRCSTLEQFIDVKGRRIHVDIYIRLYVRQRAQEDKCGGWIVVAKRGRGLGSRHGVCEHHGQQYHADPNGGPELGRQQANHLRLAHCSILPCLLKITLVLSNTVMGATQLQNKTE